MRKLLFTVSYNYHNKPLHCFLKEATGLSTHSIKTLKHTKNSVTVNGEPKRMVDKVFVGDSVEIIISEKTTPPFLWDFPVNIIYEDEDILVVNKPSGISAHPSHNHPHHTLSNAVAHYLSKSDNIIAAARSIGRLDKVTSGVMIFAKNAYIASRLNGNMDKKYNALVWGTPEESGTINAPIYRPDPDKTERAVGKGDESITHWKLLKSLGDISLLEITTETGRTHQIRVHCAHIGHPLLGDIMYGGKETKFLKRAALHCSSITINHPVKNEFITFSAPLPEDMKNEIKKRNFS